MARDLIEITATIRHETEQALLVDDGENKVWLPKSQVQDNRDGTLTLPEWLAEDKGLI